MNCKNCKVFSLTKANNISANCKLFVPKLGGGAEHIVVKFSKDKFFQISCFNMTLTWRHEGQLG